MTTGCWKIREVGDQEGLHGLLIRDRLAAAYLLGDLDPRYTDYCRWWGAYNAEDSLQAVVLLYTGLRLPALLTFGETDGIERIFDDPAVQAEMPSRVFAHIMNGHLGALQGLYELDSMRSMIRMGLSRDDFKDPGEDLSAVRAVTHADTAGLMGLYKHYPDNFFEPYQLETGLYFGVEAADRLVSVAGVHIFSETYDLAAIGNVVTHPEHRSKGHSRRCTSRLLKALFDDVSLVALNVQKSNLAAHRVYSRLGFSDHVRYLEGLVQRRHD